MIYRTFNPRDMDGVIALWNQDTLRHPINERMFMRKILLDLNFDPEGFFVAEEAGKIRGFVYAVTRKIPVDAGGSLDVDRGWIVAMGIDDRTLLPTVGHELLRCAEAFICRDGRRRVFAFSYSPNYFYQGVCVEERPEYLDFFRNEGYAEDSLSVTKQIDLLTYQAPQHLLERQRSLESLGFRFGALRVEDIPTLLSHTSPAFRHRYRRQLLEDGDLGKFSVAVYEGAVVGACVFGDPYSSAERFGPFGVVPAFQGRGIGSVILANALAEMKRRELRTAWMQWSSRGGAAEAVYEKAGFFETANYITYCKDGKEQSL